MTSRNDGQHFLWGVMAWWPLTLLLLSFSAQAHSPLSGTNQERLANGLGAAIIGSLWLMYHFGTRRVRPSSLRWLLFQTASLIALVTVWGPLDDWAETSAAWHMTQHMLMMVVIAPLWVLARPLPQWVAAGGRMATGIAWPLLQLARNPMLAAGLHGAVIWFWHAPTLYLLALDNPWWHVVEHACFLLSAGIFWWSVLRSNTRTTPAALLALLFTLMHTGFLGALLTFAHAPLYGEERTLASQQLAGMIMWILGGFPYLIASVWCGHRLFQQLQRRATV